MSPTAIRSRASTGPTFLSIPHHRGHRSNSLVSGVDSRTLVTSESTVRTDRTGWLLLRRWLVTTVPDRPAGGADRLDIGTDFAQRLQDRDSEGVQVPFDTGLVNRNPLWLRLRRVGSAVSYSMYPLTIA